MNAPELYRTLVARDVRIIAAGDDLRIDAPAGVITDELRAGLRAGKTGLLALLRSPPIFADFETRSPVSLRNAGARAYASDPSTEVLCFVAMMPDGNTVEWTPGMSAPTDLFDAVRRGIPVVAHNGLWFDRFIWERLLGWPDALWIDSLQLARLLGLPGDLDGLAMRVLGRGKDIEGKKLTLALSRRDRRTGALRVVDGPTRRRVITYCEEDVRVLRDVWHCRLASARHLEERVRDVDRIINDRGFLFDADLAGAIVDCDALMATARRARTSVGEDILRSPAKLKSWLANEGVEVEDIQRDTLRGLLSREDLPGSVRDVINARVAAAGVAAAKVRRALVLRGGDGRVRDAFTYHGAHTGRWSGRGFQPHNLPRGFELDVDAAIAAALARDVETLREIAERAGILEQELLATLVRPTIIAPEGYVLGIVDFASIEARALLWIARDEASLTVFRSGEDPYCVMAAALYAVDASAVTSTQRQLGKVLILGCGYQMGAERFRVHAAGQGIDWTKTPITPAEAVEAWRDRHPLIAGWRTAVLDDGRVIRRGGFWRLLEHAAHRAAENGTETQVGRTTWLRDGSDVVCLLPSGRRLIYPEARIEESKRAGKKRQVLTFSRGKRREETYGGKLAENVTQAVCRELLAEALVRLEGAGIATILHVHDEIVAELRSEGDLERMKEIVGAVPTWAESFPIALKAHFGRRYTK